MNTNVFDNFIGLKAFHKEMVEFTKYNPDKTVSEAMEAVKLILLHKFNDRDMILDSSSIKDCSIKPGDLLAANSEDGSSEFYGWVCPICGSVYSPDTKECISCRNNRAANANCIINTVNYSGANKTTAPLGELTNMDKTQQPINNEIQ